MKESEEGEQGDCKVEILSDLSILIENDSEEKFDQVVRESKKAILMSKVNVKPSPRGAFTLKKHNNKTNKDF